MQITDIKVTRFTWPNNVTSDADGHAHPGPEKMSKGALLQVLTDEGVTGEVVAPGADASVIAEFILPRLVGQDPLRIQALWQKMYMAQRGSGGRLTDRIIAGVDQALWDLKGKAAGMPVWKMLGGYRDRIPAYGSTMCGDDIAGGLSTPAEYAEFALKLRARGYPAIKLHTWMPPLPGAPSVARDLEACAAVREAVGPDVPLMLDPDHYYTRHEAIRLGQGLQALGFTWMEEPMEEASVASYRALKDACPSLDIVGPESAAGKHWTRAEWVLAGAADRLRAGVWGVGGITPTLKICHLAESFGMLCEMHGTGAGNLAVACAVPNTTYYERGLLHPMIDYEVPRAYQTRLEDPMDSGGFVRPSSEPGLGLGLDYDWIAAHPD